ncbi:MAG: Ig-like domain-containing protein, partial [Erysipelotrichaceae bacterium]|nr:Ig-like domain-containing protein [Erysipelotrichaceae bacterium]
MKKVKAILVLTLAALILVGCGPKTIAPTEVVLSETEVTLEDIGKTYQIQATVKPDDTTDKTLGYESADTAICTVDGNGLVTAVAPGETTVKVSCGEISASLKVKVNRVKKVMAVYYNVLVECAEEYYPTLTMYDDMTFQYMENFYQGMTKLTGTYTKVEQEYILTVTEQNTYGESVSVSWPEIRLMILNDNYLHLMTKMSMSQYYDVLSKDK